MNKIQMHPVESSQIKAVGWDKSTLAVQFKNGDLWHYEGVPISIYEYLKGSHSVGGTFAAAIKNKYSGKKVS